MCYALWVFSIIFTVFGVASLFVFSLSLVLSVSLSSLSFYIFSPSLVLFSLVGLAWVQFVSCYSVLLTYFPVHHFFCVKNTGSHARKSCPLRIAGIPQPACAGPIEIHDSLPFGGDNVETQPVAEADAEAMAFRLSQETGPEEPNLGEEDVKLLRRSQLDLKQASKDEDGSCADGQKPAKAPRGRKPKTGGPKAAAKARAKAAAKAKAKAKVSAEAKAKAEGPKKAKSKARKNNAADGGDGDAAVPDFAAEPKRKQKKVKHAAGPDGAVEAADADVANLGKPKGEKCFAKRRMPSTPFQRAKFVAIRAAFESKIKPLLTTFSAHEDCLPGVFTLLVLEVSVWVLF